MAVRTREGGDQRVSILVWIGLGLLGGLIGGWLLGSRGRVLLGEVTGGVLGAILGGFMASVLLGLDVTGLEWTGVLVAVVGAAVLILLVHALPPTEVFN
jgi:uncharacterized membrane protein YeaQ/YmgE (transglycosylase-associated protein family)